MTQENEKLRALCVAQEAEIARLQNGFDELLEIIENWETMTEYGLMVSCGVMTSNINRITGENNDH